MITIGSDVEVAVRHGFVPVDVCGMLGCSKDEPAWFENFNIQEDNVNAEYAINPASSLDEWLQYHNEAITTIGELLPEGHTVLFQPATFYTDDQLKSESSKVFGCDPDFSAWSGMPNRAPNPDRVGTMRTCGGHIHVGVDGVVKEDLIKWMDIYLGLPSLFMDYDKDRRKMYGKAGSYRPKPYGVEYRALSNFWAETQEGLEWAYRQTIRAVEMSFTDILKDIPNLTNIPRSINKHDLRDAELSMEWFAKEGLY